MAIIEGILWVIFTLLCILVSGVILLQEGKGGGLGEAFGGAGQQTFGVKAQGIAKFTGYAAAALVVIALAISHIRSSESVLPDLGPAPAPAPADGGATTGGTTGGAPPAGNDGN